MKEIAIGEKVIGVDNPTFLIAEAGLNHNGDLQLARELVSAAAESGADAVKFQTFSTSEFIAAESPYYKIFEKSELTPEEFSILKEEAESHGIIFFSTPFDFPSVDVLVELGVPLFKIASCDLTNIPLIRYIAGLGKPVLMSAGTGSLGETIAAVEAFKAEGNDQLALFHCIAHYPSNPEEMNLRSIPFLESTLQLPVGLSDHSLGIEIPLAAVAIGAKMIEKHFTLDKEMPGPDHKLSATPAEFSELAQTARKIESALGEYGKVPPEDDNDRRTIRRSIVVREDIPAGTKITRDVITLKRPGDGLSPVFIDFLIGRVLRTPLNKDDRITLDALE